MHPFKARIALGAGLLALVAACGKDSTAPIKPANVTSANGGASGTVGAALAIAPTFTVLDASGNAMANVAVTVAVTGGGGSITGSPTKSGAGATPVGTWTLGTTAGANSLTVTVSGLSPIVITATGTPDVPSQLTVNTTATPSAFANTALTAPLTFKLGDRFNNGIAGQTVTFAVIAGGGSLAGTTSGTTDANGLVTAPAWTLGKTTVAQQLRATSGAFTATANATVTSDFNLDVRFFGAAIDPTIQDAFTSAAMRIQAIVTGDMQNFSVSQAPLDVAACGVTGVGSLPIGEQIDDIRIYAQVKTIDGVGNVLGSAGPCYTRDGGTHSGLTLIAVMTFDVADLQNLQSTNRLNDVILHEMLHTVGVGTLWHNKGQVSGEGTPSVAFIGANAVAGCLFHGGLAANQCGGGTVPVEATGGQGTRDVHWRESTSATGVGLRTELMTGFISAVGVANPLSRITIGSLADIGYVVNLSDADAYTVPSTLVASLATIREAQGLGEFTINETVLEPIAAVSASGRVTPLRRRP